LISRIALILIVLILVLMTMLYGGVHQPVLATFYGLTALLVMLWAVNTWVNRTLPISKSCIQLPLLALGFYAVVQVIPFGTKADGVIADIPNTISADPFATSLVVVQILSLLIFLSAVLIFVDSANRLLRLAQFLTIFGFGYAFFAILQSVLSPEAIYGIYRPQATPFGTFVNRNDYAAMIVMLMGLPLGMLFSGAIERDKRLLYIVAAALMAISLLLSQSRGGLIAFVAEIILLVIFTTRNRGTKKLLLTFGLSTLLLLIAVGGAFFVAGETSLVRFSGNDVSVEAPTQTTSRFHIWGVTTRMIEHNLPFGVGLGAFPAVYPAYDTGSGYQRVEQAHNDYLQLLSDGGIVGGLIGVFFLYLLAKLGRKGLRVDNTLRRGIAAGALAGLAAILVHSFFDFVLHVTAVSLMFLMLLGVLVASCRTYDDDVQDLTSHHRHSGRGRFKSLRRDS
jgi:O-antigen ligase